jgi:hypothetical protein
MDHLAKRTIQLTMKEGHQPIQDKTLVSQLERAIEDIEVDFKKLRQFTICGQLHILNIITYSWFPTDAIS